MHYSMRASVIYANIALSGPDSGVVLSEIKMREIHTRNLEIFVAGGTCQSFCSTTYIPAAS